jgi:hypothetical protein
MGESASCDSPDTKTRNPPNDNLPNFESFQLYLSTNFGSLACFHWRRDEMTAVLFIANATLLSNISRRNTYYMTATMVIYRAYLIYVEY